MERSHLAMRRNGKISIVEFADRKILDELAIQEITDELRAFVEAHPKICLILSFRNVEHLSSAALSMLITLNNKVKEVGGILKLSEIVPAIYELFKITRLNTLFDIHDSEDAAIASF